MRDHQLGYLVLIVALTISLRLLLLPYGNGLDGNPVDVYYVDGEAAKLIAELRDPYLFSNYTNHYGGIVTFAYLPLIPIYFAPFVLVGADIRYGSIIADAVIAVAIYFVARSISRNADGLATPFIGSIAYAVLPVSIWLTAVVGSNLMIGTMFLMVGLATLFEERWVLAGVFFGMAFATNQLVVLTFPIIALYSLRGRNLRTPVVSILVALAIVLPFLLYSPSKFLFDVLLFQFERPTQQNGPLSLYYLVQSSTGFEVGTYLRILIFLVPTIVISILLSKTKEMVLAGVVAIGSLGAFVLPVDGFWSYFLLPITVCCALLPTALKTEKGRRSGPARN